MAWNTAPCAVTATHLVDRDDLAVGLLDLAELAEEVPEPRLGDDHVVRKNAHAVDLGGRVGLSGQMAPNDLVFLEATWSSQYCAHEVVNVSSPAIAASGSAGHCRAVFRDAICRFARAQAHARSFEVRRVRLRVAVGCLLVGRVPPHNTLVPPTRRRNKFKG